MKRCILLVSIWLVGSMVSPCLAGVYTLYPNEDLTPLEWYVWPGGSPNHWSLIDEGDPYDNQFVHGNTSALRDRYGFTEPQAQGGECVTEIRFHIKAEIELRGAVSEAMSLKYFIGGVEKGSTEFQATSDGIYNWVITFPEGGGPLSSVNTLQVEIETQREYPASMAVHYLIVQVVSAGCGGKGPDPHEE